MPDLVAIAIPTGPRFLAEFVRAWEEGNAVLPVDPRLPLPAAQALFDAMAPAVVVDEAGEPQRRRGGRPVDAGVALVVATSGTTGDPKGVVLTRAAVEASARATSARLGVEPDRDVWLAALPVAHIGGLAVITRALLTETQLTFDLDDPRATLTAMVPTQLERHDIGRFRAVLAGGSSDWRQRPPNVIHTYGLTETGSGVVYDGRAVDGVEVRLAVDGEIEIRGGMLLAAYRDGRDPKTPDGWLATGDIGELDGDGRLVVHGRRDDAIVTGGEKVWPEPVEAILRTVAGVGDVMICGTADPEWGHRVVAHVVPSAGHEPPRLEALRDAIAAVMPRYAAPRELVVVESIPRTERGKLRRVR